VSLSTAEFLLRCVEVVKGTAERDNRRLINFRRTRAAEYWKDPDREAYRADGQGKGGD
jgi:hypothetical protein